MKQVLNFIRLTGDGVFEHITWFRNLTTDQLSYTKKTIQPTPEQALQIASSQFQEVILSAEPSIYSL